MVIPDPSSPSHGGVVELRPPHLLLSKISASKPQSVHLFSFGTQPAPARGINVSKSDSMAHLMHLIRSTLDIPVTATDFRAYKIPLSRRDKFNAEITVQQLLEKTTKEQVLELPLKDEETRTVGELGIVEPFIGFAVEYRVSSDTPFPTDIPITSSSPVTTPTRPTFASQGRTLGAAPSTFTSLNRPRSSSPRTTHEKTINLAGSSEDEDDTRPVGISGRTSNGKEASTVGMMLPGAYPRSPTGVRSSSAERYGDRNKGAGSFSARFTQPAKEERIKGTTGLNNLGTPPLPLPPPCLVVVLGLKCAR